MIVLDTHAWIRRDPLEWMKQALALPRVELMPISPAIAIGAAGLPSAFPGDPADRLIVATALDQRVAIVTRDARIRGFAGVATVWS